MALIPVELKVLSTRSLMETQLDTVVVSISMIRNSHSLVCRVPEAGQLFVDDASTQSSKTFVFILESRQVQLPPEDELDDHECPFL